MKKFLLLLLLPLILLGQSASALLERSQLIFDLSCQNKAIAKILMAEEVSGVKQSAVQLSEYRTVFFDNEQMILNLLLLDAEKQEVFVVDVKVFETLDGLIVLKAKFLSTKREQTVMFLELVKVKLSGDFEVVDPEVFGILDLLIAEADKRFYKSIRPGTVENLKFIVELLHEF